MRAMSGAQVAMHGGGPRCSGQSNLIYWWSGNNWVEPTQGRRVGVVVTGNILAPPAGGAS
jgi:hypothetical protein